MKFPDSSGPDTLKVFDVNLRQNFYNEESFRQSLIRADVVKLNDEELPILAGMLKVEENIDLDKLQTIIKEFRLKLAALTRGAKGSLLGCSDEYFDHPGGVEEHSL